MLDPECIICKGPKYYKSGLCHYLCCISKKIQQLEKCEHECSAYYHKECILTEIFNKEKIRVLKKDSELPVTNSDDSYKCLNCFRRSGFKLPESKINELKLLENNEPKCIDIKKNINKYPYINLYLLYVITCLIFDIYYITLIKNKYNENYEIIKINNEEYKSELYKINLAYILLFLFAVIGQLNIGLTYFNEVKLNDNICFVNIKYITVSRTIVFLFTIKIIFSIWTILEFYNITNVFDKSTPEKQNTYIINSGVSLGFICASLLFIYISILLLILVLMIIPFSIYIIYCIFEQLINSVIKYRQKIKNYEYIHIENIDYIPSEHDKIAK